MRSCLKINLRGERDSFFDKPRLNREKTHGKSHLLYYNAKLAESKYIISESIEIFFEVYVKIRRTVKIPRRIDRGAGVTLNFYCI